MKYLNAQIVLPQALVAQLQDYVQGGYIYIPVKAQQQKRWGELSGYRQELDKRNRRIKAEYQAGLSIDRLAEKNSLSIYTVRKIIYSK